MQFKYTLIQEGVAPDSYVQDQMHGMDARTPAEIHVY